VKAALRLAAGAALAWFVLAAMLAPEVPLLTRALVAAMFAATLWRPSTALLILAALVPAGALLAPPPAHGAEMFVWSFLSAWLLRFRGPLAAAGTPRAVVLPATLYVACVAASWIALNIGGAAGVPAPALPLFLADAIPRAYLVFSVPQGDTTVMLEAVTGVGVLLAAAALARADRTVVQRLAWVVVGSTALLAAATLADVARQWAANGYAASFLARYTAGERFSLQVADVNAAGSQYVLAAAIAGALAIYGSRARRAAVAALLVMAPALWLTGSRTAVLGTLAAAGAIAACANVHRIRISRRQAAAVVLTLVLAAVAGTILSARGGDERGSAGRAMRLRSQFSETSARMFASAPLNGVGVGRYFQRSSEFMPPELRELYGAENAHNYFAQQFAELGIVGGTLFVWLMGAGLLAGWRQLSTAPRDAARIGLLAGAFGYLVTCVTGHPFLVAEVALPFWIAFGAVAAADDAPAASPRIVRIAGVLVAALLLVGIGRAAVTYARTTTPPPGGGLEREEVADDGTRFNWMSPHVVTYTGGGSGFLRMTLRAPEQPLTRPMVVETAIAGRVVDRRPLPSDRWEQIEIPVRGQASGPFRRVDVRVTPSWVEKRRFAQRSSEIGVALTAMLAELRWEEAGR
jgi:O-antigen ligase